MWTQLSDFDRTFATLDLFRRRFDEPVATAAPLRFAVREEPDAFILTADLPGVKREDLSVEVEGTTLALTAVRRPLFEDPAAENITWERSFRISPTVDTTAVSAKLQDGVLFLRLPKVADVKPRKIDVQVA